jgi:hypothetical protein
MNDAEIEAIAKHMREVFGDKIPNPEHYPEIFNYYIKLYMYYYRGNTHESS